MASDEGTSRPARGGTPPATDNPAKPDKADKPDNPYHSDRQAEERFVDDLISRGEAVEEGEELPPGATHVIVRDEQGRRVARRVRFTAY